MLARCADLLDRGIGHVEIESATPGVNGKVERSLWIEAEELVGRSGSVIEDTGLFNDVIQERGAHLQLRPSTRRRPMGRPLRTV